MKYLYLILSIITFCNCKHFIEKKYSFNKKFSFASRTDYAHHINRQLGVNDSMIFYCDTSSFFDFTKTLSHEVSIYYGAYVNDSIQIAKSDFLKTNKSCKGRIGTELTYLANQQIRELPLDSSTNLKKFTFHNFRDKNIPLIIEKSKKYTILLIYAYSLGGYYNDLYKEIIKVYNSKTDAYDLKIISLDNQVSYLKN